MVMCESATASRSWPSRAAFFIDSMAMKPLAPGRFSTTTCRPHRAPSFSAMRRMKIEGPTPLECGMVILTVLVGNSCPCACACACAATTNNRKDKTILVMPGRSIYFDHADGLCPTLPVRGPRYPRTPGMPDRVLAAHAGWAGLPGGYRGSAVPYHRAQRSFGGQPEGRGPGHAPGPGVGTGEAAGRRLHLRAPDTGHGKL